APPAAVLNAPLPGQVTASDLGYIDIQWSDAGAAGLDPNSFDPGDVTITGVSVDHVEVLSGGLVRYHYADDSDLLAEGVIDVIITAGAVQDLTARVNSSPSINYNADRLGPSGSLVIPHADAVISEDLGYI